MKKITQWFWNRINTEHLKTKEGLYVLFQDQLHILEITIALFTVSTLMPTTSKIVNIIGLSIIGLTVILTKLAKYKHEKIEK